MKRGRQVIERSRTEISSQVVPRNSERRESKGIEESATHLVTPGVEPTVHTRARFRLLMILLLPVFGKPTTPTTTVPRSLPLFAPCKRQGHHHCTMYSSTSTNTVHCIFNGIQGQDRGPGHE